MFQDAVDLARNYYSKLMFLYIKETRPHSAESSRLNATLHRTLKTVRDLAEDIRYQELRGN